MNKKLNKGKLHPIEKLNNKEISRCVAVKARKKIFRALNKVEKKARAKTYKRVEMRKVEYKLPREKEIACRINELRKEKKYTLKELSVCTNTSTSHLSRMLKGERGTNVEIVSVFSQFFDVPLEYILYGEKKPTEYDKLYRQIAKSSKNLSAQERVNLIELLAKQN